MKHKPIAISGSDLYSRVCSDTDELWFIAMGWPSEELDQAYEAYIADPDDEANEAAYQKIEDAEIKKVVAGWWVVDWPQHVLNPRYNSDAIYHGPMTEAEARSWQDGIEVYF